MTSISKLNNLIYLSVPFQLNESCFRVSPVHLCVWTSLRLTVFTPDLVPASSSLSAITTAVAAWIATWLIIVLIALYYAISVI